MRFHRKASPKVKGGRVQRKNRNRTDLGYARGRQIAIERVDPCDGYRHYVSPADVTAFLNLLPDWEELSIGLERVLLDCDPFCDGWHDNGTVAICAQDDVPVRLLSANYALEHQGTLKRLGVPCRMLTNIEQECSFCHHGALRDGVVAFCVACGETEFGLDGWDLRTAVEEGDNLVLAEHTDDTLKAFQLIHVLVHELGHHHDRMTSPNQRRSTRGENFAEAYALKHEAAVWEKYRRVFKVK
jgi:hypothetical protein